MAAASPSSSAGAGSQDPARTSRLFAKLSAIVSEGGVDCEGAKASASGASVADQRQGASCSYAAAAAQTQAAGSSCPVGDGSPINPASNMPTTLNSTPLPPEAEALGSHRIQSTIPMAAIGSVPHHQSQGQDTWLYPSERMFYAAMKRKGWQPEAGDMKAVVAIHNTVNERAWAEVMTWERLHCDECENPRLKRFQGRPNDLSPKARLLNFLGFAPPFDRHDWVVDRCGRDVRYVIDFYNGAPRPGALPGPDGVVPPSLFLDVRPALDSVEAAWDRLKMQFGWVTSGRWRNV